MTPPFLPDFLYGESHAVLQRLARPSRALARGKPLLATLKPVPVSGAEDAPVVLTARGFDDPAFHVAALLPQIYDAWVGRVQSVDDETYGQLVREQTDLYRAILNEPWGVLCALTLDAQVWLFEGDLWQDTLSTERVRLLLNAVQRQAGWLTSLDGRYVEGGGEPGALWRAHTLVTQLAVRAKLPPPSSSETWLAMIQALQTAQSV